MELRLNKMSKFKRGDVFFADLGNKCRPWLVVSNDTGNYFSDRLIIVPLTSKFKKGLPTHMCVCYGNIRPSVVQCEEIQHVTILDEWNVAEHFPPEIMLHVDEALKIAIGVE